HRQFLVRKLSRILDRGDLDLVAVDNHQIAFDLHFARKAAVYRVVAQQMRVGFHRTQIVHAHNDDVGALRFHNRAQDQTPDAAKAVDRDAKCHFIFSSVSPNPPLEGGSKFAKQISGRGQCRYRRTPPRKILSDFSTLPQGEGEKHGTRNYITYPSSTPPWLFPPRLPA